MHLLIINGKRNWGENIGLVLSASETPHAVTVFPRSQGECVSIMPLFGKSHKSPADIVRTLKENLAILVKQDKKTDKVEEDSVFLCVCVSVNAGGLRVTALCEIRTWNSLVLSSPGTSLSRRFTLSSSLSHTHMLKLATQAKFRLKWVAAFFLFHQDES